MWTIIQSAPSQTLEQGWRVGNQDEDMNICREDRTEGRKNVRSACLSVGCGNRVQISMECAYESERFNVRRSRPCRLVLWSVPEQGKWSRKEGKWKYPIVCVRYKLLVIIIKMETEPLIPCFICSLYCCLCSLDGQDLRDSPDAHSLTGNTNNNNNNNSACVL